MLLRIGDIEVWRILDCISPMKGPDEFFPGSGAEGVAEVRRLAPRQICPDTGGILIPIQGFLIVDGPLVVLVDTCVGNDKNSGYHDFWDNRQDDRFMASLTAAGVTPSDVTHVLCTHLHIDHVGWNTQLINGQWVPTFPNARYLISQADNDEFNHPKNMIYTESVAPVIAAGQAEFVGPEHGIGDHIRLIPTPGHTPGHVSVEIRAKESSVVITGDALHSPAQCWHPEWKMFADRDADQAQASRRALLAHAVERNARVLGSHFPLPSAGRVRASGAAFEWIEDE